MPCVSHSASGTLKRLCLTSSRKECSQGGFDTFVFHSIASSCSARISEDVISLDSPSIPASFIHIFHKVYNSMLILGMIFVVIQGMRKAIKC